MTVSRTYDLAIGTMKRSHGGETNTLKEKSHVVHVGFQACNNKTE